MRRLLVLVAVLVMIVPGVALAQTPEAGHDQPTIAGTAFDLLPVKQRRNSIDPRGGGVEVIVFGPIGRFGTIPAVVRNNSSETVSGIVVKVEARDADGKLLGVGESYEFFGGFYPYFMNPGDIAIGEVNLDGGIPANAILEFSVTAGDPSDFMADLNADIQFSDVEWLGDRIVGTAVNPHDVDVTGVFMNIACFSSDGDLLFVKWESLTDGDISAGGTSTFQVGGGFSDYDQCENFLIAGTGSPD